MHGPYQVLSTEQKYGNHWISVREDSVIHPDGTEGLFGIVEMRQGSSVLVLTETDEVYLVKEYKYAIGKESMQVVSGNIEDSEQPLDAAKRELEEELGLKAVEWIGLGEINPFTRLVNCAHHIFLARGVEEGESKPDKRECLQVLNVSFPTAIAMVMNGDITHSPSCVLILKANEYLRRGSQASGEDPL